MKNSMFFYEQVCVRNRTLKEIAANCDSRITHTTYAVMTNTEPREWGLFTTVYLRNGPTVDLIKRFHSFTDASIDDRSALVNPSSSCWSMIFSNPSIRKSKLISFCLTSVRPLIKSATRNSL